MFYINNMLLRNFVQVKNGQCFSATTLKLLDHNNDDVDYPMQHEQHSAYSWVYTSATAIITMYLVNDFFFAVVVILLLFWLLLSSLTNISIKTRYIK